jgi:hypothetical protein
VTLPSTTFASSLQRQLLNFVTGKLCSTRSKLPPLHASQSTATSTISLSTVALRPVTTLPPSRSRRVLLHFGLTAKHLCQYLVLLECCLLLRVRGHWYLWALSTRGLPQRASKQHLSSRTSSLTMLRRAELCAPDSTEVTLDPPPHPWRHHTWQVKLLRTRSRGCRCRRFFRGRRARLGLCALVRCSLGSRRHIACHRHCNRSCRGWFLLSDCGCERREGRHPTLLRARNNQLDARLFDSIFGVRSFFPKVIYPVKVL